MTDDHLSTLPLLVSIALTGTLLATVIAWQATGVPMVALLLVPWVLVMIGLIMPQSSPAGRDASIPSPVRRRTVAAGMATAAVVAALTTAGDWSDAGDADSASPTVLAVADSSTSADSACGALTHATTGLGDR